MKPGTELCVWMDTLCIPVGEGEIGLRLLQIDMTASIYKGAISGLILDSELMGSRPTYDRISNLDLNTSRVGRIVDMSVETRARVACSVWMCRSWTLQEGQLPSSMAIQFSNEMVYLGRRSLTNGEFVECSIRISRAPTASPDVETDGTVVGRRNPGFNDTQQQAEPPHCDCAKFAFEGYLSSAFFASRPSFASVWNELAGRSTTKPTDVPLIMTNILDYKNRRLAEYHTSGDMYLSLILSLDYVPLSLFYNQGPCMTSQESELNRWVPASISPNHLAAYPRLSIHQSFLCLEYDPDSKVVASPDVLLYRIREISPLDRISYIRCSDGNIYRIISTPFAVDENPSEESSVAYPIVEAQSSSGDSSCQRAAWFDPSNQPYSQPQSSYVKRVLRYFLKRPVLVDKVDKVHTTFRCPLRVQKVAPEEISVGIRFGCCEGDLMERACDFRIIYGRQKSALWQDTTVLLMSVIQNVRLGSNPWRGDGQDKIWRPLCEELVFRLAS